MRCFKTQHKAYSRAGNKINRKCRWPELDHKEGWAPKNWCFWTVVLGKTLESPLDWKEIKPVNPKGNHPWIFIGRTDAEAEAPIFWPPDAKSWLIRKDIDAGKDWRQEEKGTTEDKMAGWHHWLNRHEFEQALGDSEGQGSPASMGSQRVGRNWVTEQQQPKPMYYPPTPPTHTNDPVCIFSFGHKGLFRA